MKGTASVVEPPKKQAPKPPALSVVRPQPVVAPRPAVVPALPPKTSVDVMALQSTYGNAAVARAAATGAIAPPAAAPARTISPPQQQAGPTAAKPTTDHHATSTASGTTAPASSPATPAAAGAKAAAPAATKPAAPKDSHGESAGHAPRPSPRGAIGPVIGALHSRAAHARKHSPPGTAVAAAQCAGVRPQTENARAAAVQTVSNMDAAKADAVKRDEFKTKLKDAIAKATPQPKTESEADKVMKTGATDASNTLRGQLSTERDAASGQLKASTADAPEQAAGPQPELHPEPLGAPPQPVSAAPVVPAPLPAEQLDYSSDRAPTDQAMAENGVTQQQLEKGNEPQFGSTLSARSTAEKHEQTAEAGYRKSEATVQDQTHTVAQAQIVQGLATMHGARGTHIAKVVGNQTGTVAKNIAERQRVTNTINGIRNQTRTKVEGILTAMESGAGTIFDAGLARAEKAYEDTFEDEKGGIGTWLTTWGSDWEELIENSLGKARTEYLRLVDVAIDDVSDFVDSHLQAAKREVADGRKQVENFVNGLDKSVKQFGDEALERVSADFDTMAGEIDQRRDGLIDKLAQQYKASYDRMSAMEEKLREENKSLWQRVYDATVGLIKKIIAFKDMLLSVLSKAAGVIGDIIADPIGFLGNLVSGVMLGLKNFMSNIGTHLMKGLMTWLFGALAGAGLTLPDKFDLEGIVSIILQILGLTYANFRARAVAIVGERVVSALEHTAEIFKIILTKGISGLWQFIKDKVGDLKSMVMDAIFDYIKEKVLIAGVTWIIGLLNPASAFFKACKAIYDIVMFFVNHGSEILDLVNAVIDSMASIAKGAIGVAATFVENALAKAIPVAIGFLASLLGLGDISGTIKKTIDKAQAPVNTAIDWAIHQAVKLVKAVGGLLGFGKKEEKPAAEGETEGARAAAQHAIYERLNGDVSVEKAEAVLPEILHEFQPIGLKSLSLGSPDQEGGLEILAEASPKSRIALLISKKVTVGVSTKITLKDDKKPLFEGMMRGPDHPNTEAPLDFAKKLDPTTLEPIEGASPFSAARQKALLDKKQSYTLKEGEVGNAALLPSIGNLKHFQPQAGFVVAPNKESRQFEILSWNTSEPVRDDNPSHAERQALDFLRSRPATWLSRVVAVDITIQGRDVCPKCEEDLNAANAFLERHAEDPRKPKLLEFKALTKKSHKHTGAGEQLELKK